MSVSFQILPERGLVYVRYQGRVCLDDTISAFADYARHPDQRPGLKQFVDLTAVEEIETDFAKLMAVQAQKAGTFMEGASETLMVYLATTSLSQKMAQMIVRSWEPFPAVVPLVIDDEAEALSILGLPVSSVAELLSPAA